MRFVVFGAGAIGGVVAARLFAARHDVIAVARGAHARAIAARGLELRTPDETTTLAIPVVERADAIAWHPEHVVLLAVKSQHTETAVGALAGTAPRATPIVCLQNGVANEEVAARSFTSVYAVSVICPALHLEPGVVEASASPLTGILDLGRYPEGSDAVARAIASAFTDATFASIAREDIMRWKWSKLLMNLGNAIEAACGPDGRRGRLATMVRDEGVACLRAAGIAFVSEEEDAARRSVLRLRPIGGKRRPGGSTWQSLARRSGNVETDFLNGEIVRLGERVGVATPVNRLLCAVAAEMARAGTLPGSYTERALLDRLSAA